PCGYCNSCCASVVVCDSLAPVTDRGQDAHLIDCVIVGGGVAGLSAALFLGRSGRSTVVFDDGSPRILAVDRVREFLGHDGEAPPDLLARERSEVLRYGVDVVSAQVDTITPRPDGM